MSARSPAYHTSHPAAEKCRHSLWDVGRGWGKGGSRDTSRTGSAPRGLLLRFGSTGIRLFDAGFLFRAIRNLFTVRGARPFRAAFPIAFIPLAFWNVGHKNLLNSQLNPLPR